MKQSPSSRKKSTLPDFEAESAPVGSQADHDAFVSEARALASAEVLPMRADLALALQNVQVGVAAVLAEGARVAALPETDSCVDVVSGRS